MSRGHQLPLANGMPDFYTGDRTARRPKGFEAEHGTCQPFHCPMVLLHEVIEIFRVADDNSRLVNLVVVRDRCRVATTLIDGDLLRQSLSANGLT